MNESRSGDAGDSEYMANQIWKYWSKFQQIRSTARRKFNIISPRVSAIAHASQLCDITVCLVFDFVMTPIATVLSRDFKTATNNFLLN
jgi:hypothetical protein